MQWVGARVLPLRAGVDSGDIDWASIALIRPEVVSVIEATAFSGIAYLYMAVCFYVMFAGLILLYTIADDYWATARGSDLGTSHKGDVPRKILHGLFRCSVLGMLMAICMVVQGRFLSSDASDVWVWLFTDIATLWLGPPPTPSEVGYGFAVHYLSMIVALPTCAVMTFGIIRVRVPNAIVFRMATALLVVFLAYLLVGAFPGFAVLLAVAMFLGVYGLVDPDYSILGKQRAPEERRAS